MYISGNQPCRIVDIVIYPKFKSFEAIGPMTVFTYANKHLEMSGRQPGYEIRVVSTRTGAVASDTLMTLVATRDLGDKDPAHSVLIVGAHDIERIVEEQADIVEWTMRTAPNVQRFAALCSGAFFLAATGLLNGKRATTHWRMASKLQETYPDVQVDVDSIFICEGNLWTSAGVSASIDLALAFVEADYGHDLALHVARDLVIFLKRPGGQSQFSVNLTAQLTKASGLRSLQEWILENLDKKIAISQLSKQVSMSTRNFTRVFQREVGMCPSDFIERARLDKAKRLLSESELQIKNIAFKCGFATADQMRIVFLKHLSVTPKDYRERFL